MKSRPGDAKRQAAASIEACSQVADEVKIAAPDVLESQERVGTSIDETPLKIDPVATLQDRRDEEQGERTNSEDFV